MSEVLSFVRLECRINFSASCMISRKRYSISCARESKTFSEGTGMPMDSDMTFIDSAGRSDILLKDLDQFAKPKYRFNASILASCSAIAND